MDKTTHEVRLANWKSIIEQCQQRPEEQTAKQWMMDHDISEKSYYYWLRKIRKEAYEQMSSINLPATSQEGTVTFAELPVQPQGASESFGQSYVSLKLSAALRAVRNMQELSHLITHICGRIIS